jgi:hypothetical protein
MLYVALACCGFAVAGIHRQSSRRARPLVSSHRYRCRARPLFSELRRGSFVLDALVESCDDQAVPRGMPISLHVVPPARAGDWIFSQVWALVERGRSISVELRQHEAGYKARLCANGWMVHLELKTVSGWP